MLLDLILADTTAGRLPDIRQRRALTHLITACLTDLSWRRDDLHSMLAGWDIEPLSPAYPLIRERLHRFAPRLGHCCPDCLRFTGLDISDPLTGYCFACNTITAFPPYPTAPSSDRKDEPR